MKDKGRCLHVAFWDDGREDAILREIVENRSVIFQVNLENES